MEVTVTDLLWAIDELTSASPLATSQAVKNWLDKHGIAWDAPGRNGALLEAVDREIGRANQPLLKKWKAPGGPNAGLAWNRAGSTAAQRWAAENGWARVRLIDERWVRVDEHGIPLI